MTTPFFRMVRGNDQSGEGAYFSCREIEGAITLTNTAITMCGHVHSSNKGMPLICSYSGGIIQSDDIKKAREDLRRKNQTDADTPCKGCLFLQKRVWPQANYPVDHITIGHYTPCNLLCSYCYRTSYSDEENAKLSIPPYSAVTAINSLIDQGMIAPNTTAWLTGGEPTLFVDFDEIMTLLLNNNIRITIGTNCTIYSNMIAEGLRRNLVEVLCSIDAGTRSKYRDIKGKDLYEAVCTNLARYAAINKATVIAKYIFMDDNSSPEEALAFVKMCRLNNIGVISISRDILRYRGVLSSSQTDMPESMFRAIVIMMFEAIKNGIEVVFDANWLVFTDAEVLKIKLLLLECIIENKYLMDNVALRRYYSGIACQFDYITENAHPVCKPFDNRKTIVP